MKSKTARLLIDRLSVYINIAILLVIIIITCTHFPGHGELSFDYMGIIVGALSLLVTILVGWQIYSTIEIKKEAQKTQQFRNEYKTKLIEIEKSVNEKNKEELLKLTPVIIGIRSPSREVTITACFNELYIDKDDKGVAFSIAFEFLYDLFKSMTDDFNNLTDNLINEMATYLSSESVKVFFNELGEDDSAVKLLVIKLLLKISEKQG